MTARAQAVLEGDVDTRIDSHAVILIVHRSSIDDNIRARPNVKGVSIMAERSNIASGVIDRHARDCQTLTTSNANSLPGRILYAQRSNC